jgi:hypothetical protein
VTQNVLAHHNPHVDDYSDGNGDAGQGHDVGLHANDLHGDETQQHVEGQHQADGQAASQVQQYDEHHDHGNQDFLGNGVVQRPECLVDQAGPVVKRHDRHLADRGPGRPVRPRHTTQVG